jgi:uncharacterized protein YecT (DUF1311 family)
MSREIIVADDHPLLREALEAAVGRLQCGVGFVEADSVAAMLAAAETSKSSPTHFGVRWPVRVLGSLIALAYGATCHAEPGAAQASLIACESAQTQLDLNACAGQAFAAADARLKGTYRTLRQRHADNPVFVAKLRAAQRAWVAFRDAELAAAFACAGSDPKVCWGSVYPMAYALYKAQLTDERTRRLEQLLEQGPGPRLTP